MNDRPLAMVSLAFLIGLFLSGYSVFLGVCLLLVVEIGIIIGKSRYDKISFFILFLPLIAYIGILYGNWYQKSISLNMKTDENKVISLEGTVYKRETKGSKNLIYLKCNSKNNILVNLKTHDKYLMGNTIKVTGKLKKWDEPRNEGQFDLNSYYSLSHINYSIDASKIELLDGSYDQYRESLEGFREKMKDSYYSIMNEKEASILTAMILGEKNELDTSTKDLYQKNGISHILVISGLHISFIGMVVYKLLRKSGLSFFAAGIISIFIIICYGVMTGTSTSTVRALIMFTISIGAQIFGRTYDMVTSLLIAAILILLENPLFLTNAGFLLSFGAIIGAVLIGPALEKVFSIKGLLFKSIFSNLGINLITLPILTSFFYEFPVYSFIINLLILPLSTVLLLMGFLGGIIGMFHNQIGIFAIAPCHYILMIYETICEFFIKLPGAVIIVGKTFFWQIIIYFFVLLTMLFLLHKSKGKVYLCMISVMIGVLIYPERKGMEITFIDVGQGDCIYVRTPANHNYLVDGGSANVSKVGKYRIIPFLKYNGVQCLDFVFVTHADEDHVSGIKELMEESKEGGIRINTLVLPDIEGKDDSYIKLEELAKKCKIRILYVKRGDMIQDKEVFISCLHPSEGYQTQNRNEYSSVLSLGYKEFELLLTGDLEGAGEETLINENSLKTVDVLKVPHHGSKDATGSEFLSLTNPLISIISCGEKNSYGHPHEELVNRLIEQGSTIYMTKSLGAITIETDGRTMKIKGFLE